jgi:hypothetical protein
VVVDSKKYVHFIIEAFEIDMYGKCCFEVYETQQYSNAADPFVESGYVEITDKEYSDKRAEFFAESLLRTKIKKQIKDGKP